MFRTSLTAAESEPQVGFLFHVIIGANALGEFRSVKGIGKNVDVEEFREGGRNHAPHVRMGPGKYSQCRIEWGLANRATLFDWIHAVEAGYGFRRQVWVIQLTRDRMPLRIYQLWDAWPVSWEGARLDANENVVDTEEIVLAYELLTMVNIPNETSLGLSFVTGMDELVQSFEFAGTELGDTSDEEAAAEAAAAEAVAGTAQVAETATLDLTGGDDAEEGGEEATADFGPPPAQTLRLSGGLSVAPTVFATATEDE